MARPVLVKVQKGDLATGPPYLEYPGSFVLWPLAGTQPPVSGLTFWNQTRNVYFWYYHGLIV
ncbi:unnamed protein product [Prunus armeniaca]